MSDVKPKRTALLHIRVLPELRQRLDADAKTMKTTPSALARKIIAKHYEK